MIGQANMHLVEQTADRYPMRLPLHKKGLKTLDVECLYSSWRWQTVTTAPDAGAFEDARVSRRR